MQYNHLVGTIYNVPYDTLVQVFGDPDPMAFDPFKSDAGWTTTDSDGKKISIYNWKNGPNYCGPAGIPVKEIVQWNIGGTSSDDVTLVKQIIKKGEQCTIKT
tara:strand:- start:73 stop:378 length:306 start_codon:yes stop_codon:yes gene_type:complete